MLRGILKDFHAGHPGSTRMKSLMRSYIRWPNMDKYIENAVKSCKGCVLTAKAPPIKFNPCPKTDLPWSRVHINFADPLEGYFFPIVVNLTTEIIKFLHELFAGFGVVDALVPR